MIHNGVLRAAPQLLSLQEAAEMQDQRVYRGIELKDELAGCRSIENVRERLIGEVVVYECIGEGWLLNTVVICTKICLIEGAIKAPSIVKVIHCYRLIKDGEIHARCIQGTSAEISLRTCKHANIQHYF
jgi:hypothetical protein